MSKHRFVLIAAFVLAAYCSPIFAVPQKHETDIAQLAPASSDLCIVWNAGIKPDPNGASLERWLAQPEIQDGIKTVYDLIEKSAEQESEVTAQLFGLATQLAFDQPWIVYIDKFDFENLAIKFALRLGDQEQAASELMKKLETEELEESEKFHIAGKEFTRIPAKNDRPEIEFGITEGYLVAASNNGELAKLLEQFATPAPPWIADVRSELPIDRTSGTFRIDFAHLHELAKLEGDIPPELHLEQFQNLSGTFGFEGQETVTRLALHCPSELTGILKTLDVAPMKLEDLSVVPDSIHSLFAGKFTPKEIWKIIQNNSETRSGVAEFAKEIENQFGIDVENDIINSFDEFVYSYQSLSVVNPAANAIVVVRIKDPEAFQVRLEDIVETIDRESDDFMVEVTEAKQGNIYQVVPVDNPMGIPLPGVCFSLQDNQLFFAADPKAIASHLRKADRTTDKLIGNSRFAGLFDSEKNQGLGQPLGVQYLDLKPIFEAIYSFVPMFAGGMGAGDGGFDFDTLPPLDVVINGIEPDLIGIYRTEQGFQFYEKTTLPGLTSLVPLGVGLTLPAVVQVRGAAKQAASQNNLRQLLLANLNFESAFRSFPAAHTKNDEGKKLLSWRVHILPFLEEQELYERFHLDEPWDSEHNLALVEEMPTCFSHPGMDLPVGQTVYLGVAGDDAAFSVPQESTEEGQMTPGTKMREFLDGTSKTIMIVEANAEHAVTWTSPEDLNIDEVQELLSVLRSNEPGGAFGAGFCDGSVQLLLPDSDEDLKKMMTRSGGEVIER